MPLADCCAKAPCASVITMPIRAEKQIPEKKLTEIMRGILQNFVRKGGANFSISSCACGVGPQHTFSSRPRDNEGYTGPARHFSCSMRVILQSVSTARSVANTSCQSYFFTSIE